MTTYAWPSSFKISRFEMRVIPNTLTFTSPYTKATQTVDLFGERLGIVVDLDREGDPRLGAAREAFFDRLKGQVNLFSIWNIRFPQPQGTLRDGLTAVVKNASNVTVSVVNGSAAAVTVIYGQPAVQVAIAQNANTGRLTAVPGYTLYAGDMLGINNQLVRIMVDATTDGSGNLDIEFLPRARAAWPVGTAAVWNKPTANFMLKTSDGVPVPYVDVFADVSSFEAIEAF